MAITHWSKSPSFVRWLSLALAALLLAACATKGDMMESLNTSLRSYEKAVRWAKFDAVYSFHKWEANQEPTLPANMGNIRVTNYESSEQKFDPKNQVMKQTVTLRYYNTDDLRERTIKFHHEWKFFPKTKHWYLISDPIRFP